MQVNGLIGKTTPIFKNHSYQEVWGSVDKLTVGQDAYKILEDISNTCTENKLLKSCIMMTTER